MDGGARPLKASAEPAELVVQASADGGQESGKKVILKNILVGEVWMASGQSNMQWTAAKSSASNLIAQLTEKGETPPIREFEVKTKASQTYNVLTVSFTPAALNGLIFLCNEDMFKADQGALYGEQFAALATCWKEYFGGDPAFFHTLPAKELAPKITASQGIKSTAIEIKDWADVTPVLDAVAR